MESWNSTQAGHLPPDGIEVAPINGIEPFSHPVDKQVAQTYHENNQLGTDDHPIDYEHHKETPSENRKTVFGMGKIAFGLCLLAVILIVAAVVGAAVGVSVAAKNKSPTATTTILASPETSSTSRTSSASSVSSSLSSASTTPSTASATATSLTVSASDCPAANGTTFTSKYTTSDSVPAGAGLTFTLYCQVTFSKSPPTNMFEVFVYSFDQCVEACASYNFFHGNRGCQGAVFNTANAMPGNCWALWGNKTGTATPNADLYYGWLA